MNLVPDLVGTLATNTGPRGHDAGNFQSNQGVDAGHVIPTLAYCLAAGAGGSKFGSGRDGQDTFVPEGVPRVSGPRVGRSGEGGFRQDLDNHGAYIPVAFSSKDHGADATTDLAPTLRAMNYADSHMNGGGQIAIAFDTTQITSPGNYSVPRPGDPCHPLAAGAHPPAVAFTERTRSDGRNVEAQEELAYAVRDGGAGTASRGNVVTPTLAVRRLLPVECCRLMGFPDSWLDGLQLSDSTKYRQLGNSVAVPVVEWLARRLVAAASTS